ncbi:selenium-dependent molybdenum cofactor biosynthesis protein YqeB [Pleomorphochaeta sp. DL1XJH-081]|uniref:selenium-dependent molybdenum cofactor biosynthesis protein YqeB n=1 Tax=Pleomorphochaeta sp. DL1XJH-081 TaxID=3409690 RepID=UPI003BB52FA7
MNLFEKAAELEKKNQAFAMVTITKSEGSTPRSQAKMIVLPDGTTYGTVGGGASEFEAINRARRCIAERRNETMDMSLTVAEGHNCGGAVELFIETIPPAYRLVLIGGGHVNLEIARLAAASSFYIELVETRAEFATQQRFPWVSAFHVGETVDDALSDLSIDGETAIIIATHNLDKQVLERVITSPACYIGMLGSRTKVNGFRRYLREEKAIDETYLKRFYSPIGLDIGSETPQQIAVGVVAELMMVLNHTDGKPLSRKAENLVIIRGAGDLATGVACRLHRAGYRVLALETRQPTTIRRTVAFSEAVYQKRVVVDGVVCRLAESDRQAKSIMDANEVALMIDPEGKAIASLRPAVVVDAIIAKKNLGTTVDMAPLVIALGPGFSAPTDCHVVVETKRGHYLGQLILEGSAQENSGVPGIINGYGVERVIHSPAEGLFTSDLAIGSIVKKGDVLAKVDEEPVYATLDGVLRGLLHTGLEVPKGFKIADIDPRGNPEHCKSVSDKALALGGAVLEAIDSFHANRLFV